MKTKPYPKTPELDKMKAVQAESQTIGAFLDHMSTSGMSLACFDQYGENLHFVRKSIEQILADYFEIDLVKVEKERRAILDAIRK